MRQIVLLVAAGVFALVLSVDPATSRSQFAQNVYITVTPHPVSDADWATQCADGMTPYRLDIRKNLTDYGTFYVPPRLTVANSLIVERRSTEKEFASPGFQKSIKLDRDILGVRVVANSRFSMNGELRACGFRRQLFVVDLDLHFEGALGVWSINHSVSGYRRQDQVGPEQIDLKFVANLLGDIPRRPKGLPWFDRSNEPTTHIDQANVWGVLLADIVVPDAEISVDSKARKETSTVEMLLSLLVLDG